MQTRMPMVIETKQKTTLENTKDRKSEKGIVAATSYSRVILTVQFSFCVPLTQDISKPT